MMATQSVMHHSPSMTASRATSHEGWSQKWLHVSENRVFHAHSSAYESLGGMPWAQGVAGSNPVAPTTSLRYIPVTWVTDYSEHIGNTFGPKGFAIGSSLPTSSSK